MHAVSEYRLHGAHYKSAVLIVSVVVAIADHLCLNASDQCKNLISALPNPSNATTKVTVWINLIDPKSRCIGVLH